jgi:hypothetical protein
MPGKSELNGRLNAHFATLRSSLTCSSVNWQMYAAVIGSALLPWRQTRPPEWLPAAAQLRRDRSPTSPIPTQAPALKAPSKKIPLRTALGAGLGFGFSFGVSQKLEDYEGLHGYASLRSASAAGVGFLFSDGKVVKLSASVTVSAHSPFATPIWEGGRVALASQNGQIPVANSQFGWAPGQSGFAAFKFQTVGQQMDFGWIQLDFTLGSNGLANSITATNWAYDNTGAPILTGETESSTPEPSTGALALLATGAAGVLALRRRRKSAA